MMKKNIIRNFLALLIIKIGLETVDAISCFNALHKAFKLHSEIEVLKYSYYTLLIAGIVISLAVLGIVFYRRNRSLGWWLIAASTVYSLIQYVMLVYPTNITLISPYTGTFSLTQLTVLLLIIANLVVLLLLFFNDIYYNVPRKTSNKVVSILILILIYFVMVIIRHIIAFVYSYAV
jgi:hypothetical protein